MIKIVKERLNKNKDKLESKLKFYYENYKILNYSDLFKVICFSLNFGINVDKIKEIDFEDHTLIIAPYGSGHDSNLMTCVESCEDLYMSDKLDNIFTKEKEGEDIFNDLLELAMEMIENIISPYNNTGDFSKVEE